MLEDRKNMGDRNCRSLKIERNIIKTGDDLKTQITFCLL